MPNNPAGESPESRGNPKLRSSKACQSCRAAKAKCEILSGELRCKRCLAASTQCLFTASRRGRVKGSKNRRTLERLRSGNGTNSTAEQPGSESGGISEESSSPRSVFQGAEQSMLMPSVIEGSQPRARRNTNDPDQGFSSIHNDRLNSGLAHRSGTTTPWNPHNLVMGSGSERPQNRPTLTTKLLQILGEFPIEEGRSDGESVDESKEFQDPMWLISGLAERGWVLQGMHANRKRPRRSSVLPSTTLPSEDAHLLAKWTPQALQEIEKESSHYYHHGVSFSKCDVADDLDPVQHGLVTDERAKELFQAYWNGIHPQWPMLDPSLHTLDYIRGRSALLTSTVLSLGSTVLANTSPDIEGLVAEALCLHSHTEKIGLVVYASGARSIDIIQAQILLCRWGLCPKTRIDEQRWIRSAMLPRMAVEIGLSVPRHYETNDGLNAEKVNQLRWNDLRTRAFLIMNEYRFFTFSGRKPMDISQFELSETELEEITALSKDGGDTKFAAFYNLFIFDRDVRRRLEQYRPGNHSSLSLDAELEHIKAYIETWIREWCPRDAESHVNWHFMHEAISCWLLLTVYVSRARFRSSSSLGHQRQQKQQKQHQEQQQQLLLKLSIRLLDESLKAPQAVRITHRAAIFPFAASIILRLSNRRDLVIRAALRMAGEPGKPSMPTFVRDAGNQMLLMLCTNNSPSSSTPKPQTSREQTGTSLNDEHETADTCRPQMARTAHEATDESIPAQDTMQHDLHNLGQLPVLEQHSAVQGNFENNFPFNITDFPYVPDPVQPQMPWQGPAVSPYLSAELDAWIGTTISNRPGLNEWGHSLGNGVNMGGTPLGQEFGLPVDPVIASPNHPQLSREDSSWGMESISPVNTGLETGRAGFVGEGRNAQREVLLAAVDRLIQLASLMQ